MPTSPTLPTPRRPTRRAPDRPARTALSTYREGSLHAELKARYAAAVPGSREEQVVDGFVVDVVGPEELIEVQTASFASVRVKLERLLERHRVVLVHSIPLEKWLVRVDDDRVEVARRRSPKRGQPLDLFEELVHLAGLLDHPRFSVELLLTVEEEVRGPIPDGARYRRPRSWWRLDRRLVSIEECRRIGHPADLLGRLPAGLDDPFTTADIVAASGRSRRLAMRAAYCLERSGATRREGRRGRHVLYRRNEITVATEGERTGRVRTLAQWCRNGQRRGSTRSR